jgi:dihydrofolate reductase
VGNHTVSLEDLMRLNAIVAMSEGRVIGADNAMIWDVPSEYNHFLKTVSGHCLVYGRKNFYSNESNRKLLACTTALVLSREKNRSADFFGYDVHFCTTFQRVLDEASKRKESELFIIGGAQIYELAMPYLHRLYLSRIQCSVQGDCFFPPHEQFHWSQKSMEHHKDSVSGMSWSLEILEKRSILD